MEEERLQKTPFEYTWKDEETSKTMKQKRLVSELTGGRSSTANRRLPVRGEMGGHDTSQNSFLAQAQEARLKAMGSHRRRSARGLAVLQPADGKQRGEIPDNFGLSLARPHASEKASTGKR